MRASLPLAATPAVADDDAPGAGEAAAPAGHPGRAAPPPAGGDALTRQLLQEFRGGRAEPPPPARPAPAAQPLRRAPSLDMLRPIAAPAAAPAAAAVAEGAAPHLGEALPGPAAALGAIHGAVEGATSEGQGGGQAPAIDIDAIAQKVYEHLRRRLRIDQERLGRY